MMFSSKYSNWSSFNTIVIDVPLVNLNSGFSSCVIVNEPPAEDSQVYCSSSLCLLDTRTVSATKNAL